MVISGGKIAAIGDAKTPIPAAAKVVNARGLDLWPGLIDAGTPLGLYEVGSLQETQDSSDSAEYQPELRTAVALHPDSELIPVARANGILSAFVQPSGGVISGQGCVIGLDGWVPSEMVVLERAGLVVNIPRYIAPGPGGRGRFAAMAAEGGDASPGPQGPAGGDPRPVQEGPGLRQGGDRRPRPQGPGPSPDPRLTALAPTPGGRSR